MRVFACVCIRFGLSRAKRQFHPVIRFFFFGMLCCRYISADRLFCNASAWINRIYAHSQIGLIIEDIYKRREGESGKEEKRKPALWDTTKQKTQLTQGSDKVLLRYMLMHLRFTRRWHSLVPEGHKVPQVRHIWGVMLLCVVSRAQLRQLFAHASVGIYSPRPNYFLVPGLVSSGVCVNVSFFLLLMSRLLERIKAEWALFHLSTTTAASLSLFYIH